MPLGAPGAQSEIETVHKRQAAARRGRHAGPAVAAFLDAEAACSDDGSGASLSIQSKPVQMALTYRSTMRMSLCSQGCPVETRLA